MLHWQMAQPLQFLVWALLISVLIFLSLLSYIFLIFLLTFCQLVSLLILNCAAIFLSTHCIFQDLNTGKIIGGGHEADGLYYLDRYGSFRLVASHLSISPL